MRRFWVATAFLVAAGPVSAQSLTAREIFYGQGSPEPPKRPAAKKAATSVPKPAETASSNQPARKEPLSKPEPSAPRMENENLQYVNLDTSPLGLKYTILKRSPDGSYTQVANNTTFLSGDQIRLVIESNSAGYLYVVTQGASRKWKPVFFSKNGDSQGNRVERGGRYSIPPGDRVMSFVSPAGTEKLFVILSRQPEKDLEQLIYSLDSKPAKEHEPERTVLAENMGPAQDDLVQRLRKTYSRDLIIEPVDDTKKPANEKPATEMAKREDGTVGPPEKAVYVVNPKPGEHARVVADIELRHE